MARVFFERLVFNHRYELYLVTFVYFV